MKTRLLSIVLITLSSATIAQNVGIGNTTFTPNASSLLELRSTTSGFLMPRMTEAQRDAISNPATGLMVYQTNNTSGYYYYTGSAWESFGGAVSIDNMGDHTATQNLVVGTGLGMTDTDEDTKVQVEQTSDEDKIRFRVAGSEAMMINTDSNIGIGTDAPSRNLQIQVANNGTNFPLFLRNSNNTNGSNGVGIAFNSEQNGDWVKAALFHERTAGFGVGKMHFLMDDVSDNGSVTLSQSRMTITHQGKVGIGTTSPDRALHVKSSTSGVNVMTLQNTQSNGWSSIDFHNQSGSLSATFGYANSGTSGIFTGKAYMNSYDNDFVLTRNSSENSLFIEGSTGDVGFNTNNPTARLDVNGDARIRDLAGSGTRMVVTDGSGNLSAQSLPSSGSTPTTVVSSSNQNINSASYNSTVSGMTISGVSAGTYLVNFNADISRNGSSSCNCIVRAGGSDVSSTERTFQIPSSGDSQFHLMGKVTLGSTGTIEIRCKKIPGGSGITVKTRAMSIQATN